MKLANMASKQEDNWEYNPPVYPYGLKLYLDEDQCEALGITKALKAGTGLALSAKAIVASATESLESDGDDKGIDVSLSIQITELGVSVNGVIRNAAELLYGGINAK